MNKTTTRLLQSLLATTLVASAGVRAGSGETSTSVPLHPLPALSTVPSTAKGSAIIDYAAGRVTIDAEDLPPLSTGTAYEALLVHNTAGPGHSVAIDPGPDGDEMIDAGTLAMD